MVWIDGLDMHIVNLLSASFRDGYPDSSHPVTRPEGSALAVAGRNLLPIDFKASSQTSPIFNYPYRATREALAGFARTRDPDLCHGYKMNYINPLNGSSAMPTITTAMQLLPKGFSTQSYQSTAGTIFSVVEGTGSVNIGSQRFEFGPKDLFVTPSWFPMTITAASEVVLFSFSDRIVQEKLDIFRERRGNG
jgi:gentisate 1,2-dioxygenase